MRRLRSMKASACNSCTRFADFEAVECWRHGLAEADGDGIRNAARHLPEKASALEAEDAAPDAVEIDGNDGRIDAFHDAFEAAAEGEQLAGARDLAFGEDADDLAVSDGVAGRAQRVNHFARALLARRWESLDHFREGLDER